MSRAFNNLLKIAGVGALLYGVYKLGEKNAINSIEEGEMPPVANQEFDDEIDNVLNVIRELKGKPKKTKRDRDNIELLEIKLKQLQNKKNDNSR